MSQKPNEENQLRGLELSEFSDFNANASFLMGEGMDVSHNLNMTTMTNNSKESELEISHLDYNKLLAKKKEKNNYQKSNPLAQMLGMSNVQARVLIGNAIELQKTNINQNNFVNELINESIISEESKEFEDASNYYLGDQGNSNFEFDESRRNSSKMGMSNLGEDLFITEMENKNFDQALSKTLTVEKKGPKKKFSMMNNKKRSSKNYKLD